MHPLCVSLMRPLCVGLMHPLCVSLMHPLCVSLMHPLCVSLMRPLCVGLMHPLCVSLMHPLCVSLRPLCVSLMHPLCVSLMHPLCVSLMRPLCVSLMRPLCVSLMHPLCVSLMRKSTSPSPSCCRPCVARALPIPFTCYVCTSSSITPSRLSPPLSLSSFPRSSWPVKVLSSTQQRTLPMTPTESPVSCLRMPTPHRPTTTSSRGSCRWTARCCASIVSGMTGTTCLER